MTDDINRRNFFRKFTPGSGSPSSFANPSASSGNGKVDETCSLASTMGYRHDALEVDTVRFPKRLGDQGEVQYCFNCVRYKGELDDAWSACSIFDNKIVAGRGWWREEFVGGVRKEVL